MTRLLGWNRATATPAGSGAVVELPVFLDEAASEHFADAVDALQQRLIARLGDYVEVEFDNGHRETDGSISPGRLFLTVPGAFFDVVTPEQIAAELEPAGTAAAEAGDRARAAVAHASEAWLQRARGLDDDSRHA